MMRPFVIMALPLAALVGTAGCHSSPEPASIGNNAEMVADALERRADNLEAMAAAAANDSAAAMLAGAGDNLDEADNGRDVVDPSPTAPQR
jgi:hypothetical protein